MQYYRLIKLTIGGLLFLGMGITQSYDVIAARRNTWKFSDLYFSGGMTLAGLALLGFVAVIYLRDRE